MAKLCIFLGVTVGSSAGWWLGDRLGWGLLGAFLLSGLGSLVGVWLGWRLGRRLAE